MGIRRVQDGYKRSSSVRALFTDGRSSFPCAPDWTIITPFMVLCKTGLLRPAVFLDASGKVTGQGGLTASKTHAISNCDISVL
ncbi:hypothetical protein [Orrella marina]|uniref:hypothetical protein n=1 Tax=Orrella marina TaxID=2163011 RepID=UPI00131F147C|nr:hypothetical protein [Orrella marina]